MRTNPVKIRAYKLDKDIFDGKWFKWEARAIDIDSNDSTLIAMIRGPSRRYVVHAMKIALDTLGVCFYKVTNK